MPHFHSQDEGEKDALQQAAMDLLNRRGSEFKPLETLQKIPTHWPIKSIQPALEKLTLTSLRKVSKKAETQDQLRMKLTLKTFAEKDDSPRKIPYRECKNRRRIRITQTLQKASSNK